MVMAGAYGSEWCMRRNEEWERQRDVQGIYGHLVHFPKKVKKSDEK